MFGDMFRIVCCGALLMTGVDLVVPLAIAGALVAASALAATGVPRGGG